MSAPLEWPPSLFLLPLAQMRDFTFETAHAERAVTKKVMQANLMAERGSTLAQGQARRIGFD